MAEHPLDSSWTMYAHVNCGTALYSQSYVPLASFQSIGGFWAAWNNTPNVEQLCTKRVSCGGRRVYALSMFRTGIAPEWEDPVNAKGGEWGCREAMPASHAHQLWLHLALIVVGGLLPDCTGVRVVDKGTRAKSVQKLEVWLDSSDAGRASKVRAFIGEALPGPLPRFSFENHVAKHDQLVAFNSKS